MDKPTATDLYAALDAGKTVYVSTPLRITKITKKCRDRWASAGIDLFKQKPDGLWMGSGNRYVFIGWTNITIQ